MIEQEEWAKFWDRAKDLEKEIAVRKKRYYSQIKAQFPNIKYQNYGRTKVACENGWLTGEIVKVVMEYQNIIADLEKEAFNCRKKSDLLLKEIQEADKRVWLDPNVDIIPEGEYPKLKKCKTYPLTMVRMKVLSGKDVNTWSMIILNLLMILIAGFVLHQNES